MIGRVYKICSSRSKKKKEKKKIVHHNAIKLFNKLLSNCFKDYNNNPDDEKEKIGEKYNPNNILTKAYMFIESKKEDEGKSKSQPEETVAGRLTLKIQKADNDSDKFINIPDMPPL